MSQKIESEKLLVKDVFKRWYRIPEYQRPYVWEADQVIELLDDIFQASQANSKSQYFLGSMVLKKSEKKENGTDYTEYDLLDGQQRLTTLFLITAVVRDQSTIEFNSITQEDDKKKIEARISSCRESIFQMANPDDSIPERIRIVFDIRDKVRDFVNEYIKTDGGTTKLDSLKILSQKKEEDISIRNMASAILTIKSFFARDVSINDFFPFLRSNVLMIYVATEELEDAFHLFTVMNNRGIKLRNSDILKAENLKEVTDDKSRTEFAKLWESIEEYFAEDFDNFLSHLRTILVKQKAGYNLLKEFEINIYSPKVFDKSTKEYRPASALLKKGKPTFDFIKAYYEHYMGLFEEDNFDINKDFSIINQITLMQHGFEADYWIAPTLRYYAKYKTQNLVEFLKKLGSKFSADWIVGLSPTKRVENINAIIKEIEKTSNSSGLLTSDVFLFSKDDLVRVMSGGIYGKKYAKHILLEIDLSYHGNTTRFNPPESISIEHILPQTPAKDSQWYKDYTEDDREKWTHRMGNLILLSSRKNISQRNYDYTRKRDKYFTGNVELFSNSIRVWKEYHTWTLIDLKKNHKEVLVRSLGFYGVTLTEDQLKDALQ